MSSDCFAPPTKPSTARLTAPTTWVAPAASYDDQHIELRLGRSAIGLHHRSHQWAVELDDGETLTSDKVVLATGSQPRQLAVDGVDLGNVLSLSTLDHARRIQAALQHVRDVVIAGAGFVGTEVAAAVRAHDVRVTIIEPVKKPMEAVLGPWASSEVRRLHEDAGVVFVRDTVAGLRGAKNVAQVVTGAGTVLPCDLFIVAIGSVPVVALAHGANMDATGGIVCDERGRTSLPGVYAIGDVASWPYGPLGRMRVEHFRTAIEHAEAVAAELTGAATHRVLVPWFWTDQYHRRVEVAGRPTLGEENIIRRASDGTPRFSLHLRGGAVVGAIGIDAPREVRAATQLIRAQSQVDPLLAADSSIDLRKVAALA